MLSHFRLLSPHDDGLSMLRAVYSLMMKPTLPAAFQAYLTSPPPGSALARAIAYGIDPTLTLFKYVRFNARGAACSGRRHGPERNGNRPE